MFQIYEFMHEVIAANPNVASLLDLGVTAEGRMLHGIKISSGAAGRKGVVMDCLMHAREWMGGPLCLRAIDELVADPELRDIADFYIVPVANPDGYVYSWTEVGLAIEYTV